MKRRWYENGIRFECSKCGKCCVSHGDYQYVYLGKSDVEAIASYLNLAVDEFFWKHCKAEDGWICLRQNRDRCRFLGRHGCQIYPVRPGQCTSWPFWTENLVYETWFSKVVPACEGVGRGRLITAEKIDKIAKERDDSYG